MLMLNALLYTTGILGFFFSEYDKQKENEKKRKIRSNAIQQQKMRLLCAFADVSWVNPTPVGLSWVNPLIKFFF
jgi:hypothetical protein